MALVAGIDSSTQSCKVVVRDADDGTLVRQGRAPHPEGTEVDPEAWWGALGRAIDAAGGLDDVAALAVGAQQHGMVCLDGDGEVVRPALLWNDTRSAAAAEDLVDELGAGEVGRRAWAGLVGSVPVASFTVTKLRWLADHEPESVRRTAAVCLPHDWLTARLARGGERPEIGGLATDRSEASGTGYFSPAEDRYRPELLEMALGRSVVLPRVLGPSASAGHSRWGAVLGAGMGDNAAAALGVGAGEGDVVVSIGTSVVVSAVADTPTADPSGIVAGFADGTGRFLPLVCTLNGARVLDAVAALLQVDQGGLSALALAGASGAGGLVLVPYFEGERTPNRPDATGALHGLQLANTTPANLARAAIEGLLCGIADGLDALLDEGVRIDRVVLVGGASRSEAVRRIAPGLLGRPVVVPKPGEYVADGAARQAAWALRPELGGPPSWSLGPVRTYEGDPAAGVRERYGAVRDLTAQRPVPAGRP